MRSLGELLLSNAGYHSFVDFVRDYLGNMAAFITGWTYWFCWISLAMADLTAVGIYTQYWLPDVPQWLPGLLALIILLIMNLATVKLFGELEFWFALIKVIAILALIVTGIFLIAKGFSAASGLPATPTFGATAACSQMDGMGLSYRSKWLSSLSWVLNWLD